MLIIALACLALAGLTVYLSFRLIRGERREHARERALLVDQVCNLAGKPWTPPPATMRTAPAREPIPDLDLAEF